MGTWNSRWTGMRGRAVGFAGVAFVVAVVLLAGCATTDTGSPADAQNTKQRSHQDGKFGVEGATQLYVEIETSSDWSGIVLPDSEKIAAGMVTYFAENGEADLNPHGIAVRQPIEDAEAGVMTDAEALVHMELSDGGEVQFGIERGHIGATTVRMWQVVADVATPLGQWTWDGIDEGSDRNVKWFTIDVPAPKDQMGREDLDYPVARLDEILQNWIVGITEFAYETYRLYWPDAEQIFIFPGRDYVVENAAETLREEYEAGPNPDTDYSLISYTPAIRFPKNEQGQVTYVNVGSYDNVPGYANVFRFEERDGQWLIAEQVLKIGVDLYPPEEADQDAEAIGAINGILDEFGTGFLEKDLSVLRDMLADGWTTTLPVGDGPDSVRLVDKAFYLNAFTQQLENIDYLEKRHIDREIHVHGPVATSVSTLITRTSAGYEAEEPVFHVYGRIDGVWQVVFTTQLIPRE